MRWEVPDMRTDVVINGRGLSASGALCDRFLDSSLAYQGAARGLGIDEVLNMNYFATEKTFPDLTLLFDLKPEVGLERIAENANRDVNRLDLEKLSFHAKVREAFHELARRFPSRYSIIDASQPIEEVEKAAYEAIKERLAR